MSVQTHRPAVQSGHASIQPEGDRPSLLGASLFGAGAALVSSLLWYGIVVVTNYELGIVAIAVGFAVGAAVVYGSGGRRGLRLQILSVAITTLAMGFSEYLVVRHFVVAGMSTNQAVEVAWLLPPALMANLVVEGIKASPMTLLFWGIAGWTAFRLPSGQAARQHRGYRRLPPVPGSRRWLVGVLAVLVGLVLDVGRPRCSRPG